MTALTLASLISGFGFLIYGIQCLRSSQMILEFQRFQVSSYRVLTGFLEILGGVGVIIGLFQREIGMISSFGLFLLMAMGVGVRLKIKDTLYQCLPALFFCLLNGAIFIGHWI